MGVYDGDYDSWKKFRRIFNFVCANVERAEYNVEAQIKMCKNNIYVRKYQVFALLYVSYGYFYRSLYFSEKFISAFSFHRPFPYLYVGIDFSITLVVSTYVN